MHEGASREQADSHVEPSVDAAALRILNLLFILNAASRPLTTDQILSDADIGYGSPNRQSDVRKFLRDRERLRTLGIVIREVRPESLPENEQGSWEIDRARTHAERGALSPDDAAIVFEAIDRVFALHADDPARWPLQRARLKLQELAGLMPTADSHPASNHAEPERASNPTLPMLWNALTERHPARFSYRDAHGTVREHTVELYGTFTQGSRSYLVGHDRDADDLRTFRCDRIGKTRVVRGESYEIPASFDVDDHRFLPFDFASRQPQDGAFSFPAGIGELELELLTQGRGALVRSNDGTWTWEIGIRDIEAAASFALAHASDGMRPLAPAELVTCWNGQIEKAVAVHGSKTA